MNQQELPSINNIGSNDHLAKPGNAKDDIGDIAKKIDESKSNIEGSSLKSDRETVLSKIKSVIGFKQVTESEIQFAPEWILNDALSTELEENWNSAYTVVKSSELPRDANIIGSHTVYRVKEDDDGHLKMKARLVLHGNRDKDRFTVRRDSASADLAAVRLLISLSQILKFCIATADIKGAYMQSGPIKRTLFVRPPKKLCQKGMVWKLLRLPYGIVEAGRQWLCAVEQWMLEEYGLDKVPAVDQLFYKRGEDMRITLIVAKVVDDFIIGGFASEITSFLESLNKRFKIGRSNRGMNLKFLGCSISREECRVTLSMPDYLQRIETIQLDRGRKELKGSPTTIQETHDYRSLAGTLLYLGQAVLPQACYVASRMQQRLGSLRVADLIEANAMIRELGKLEPKVSFNMPDSISEIDISTLSDASHNGPSSTHGQTGIISGLRIVTKDGIMYHPIMWSSHKQKRISYSSYGAEILAAADGDDRGYHLKEIIRILFPKKALKHQLLVDSKSLFETITTLHQTGDYRLRKIVARMRDSFESSELDIVRWIPGSTNFSDALTKRNLVMSKQLNEMISSGTWSIDLSSSCALDAENWK